jgi:hypothetical protein
MSSENKKVAGDLLFWFQLSMAWAFTVPQVIRSLTSTVGMTVTWSSFCTAFVLVNFFLALGAYKQSRSRKAGQVVLVYANWVLLWLTLAIIIGIKGVWSAKDTLLTILILISMSVLLIVRRKESLVATVSEPITRGIMSLLFKSVPQLFLAYCIVAAGSKAGLSWISLIVGHITIWARLLEICLAARQDGWSRRNIGLVISEVGNELSWLVATIAWLAY